LDQAGQDVHEWIKRTLKKMYILRYFEDHRTEFQITKTKIKDGYTADVIVIGQAKHLVGLVNGQWYD